VKVTDSLLKELVDRLATALGSDLKSAVLYGSAVTGEFHPRHSDLNVLCVLERLGADELERIRPAARWWETKGHPAPLVFTLEELRRAADLFAIELLDMKAHHRVLFGEDFLANLEVPMNLHRIQVERELRTNLVRLRQRYLGLRGDSRAVLLLMLRSLSSFLTLFRHALLALGHPVPESGATVVDRLGALLGFDPSACHTLLEVRAGKRPEKGVDVSHTFRFYLQAIEHVTREVDRRLEAN